MYNTPINNSVDVNFALGKSVELTSEDTSEPYKAVNGTAANKNNRWYLKASEGSLKVDLGSLCEIL